MNKKIIIILTIVIILIGTIIYNKKTFKQDYENLSENIIFNNQNNTNNNLIEKNFSQENIKIKVHIAGEINSPGLYELKEGSRINDLILMAGGETKNANINKVNLAYELSDGEKIYIPSIFDETSTYIYNEAGENVLESNELTSKNEKININKATSSDLQQISGIGPSLAEKIINYRNSNGKFNSIEELKNVSGIGDKKFESIKEYLTLK